MHTNSTHTHVSDDSPDTTLGKLPEIRLLVKARDLTCKHTRNNRTPTITKPTQPSHASQPCSVAKNHTAPPRCPRDYSAAAPERYAQHTWACCPPIHTGAVPPTHAGYAKLAAQNTCARCGTSDAHD